MGDDAFNSFWKGVQAPPVNASQAELERYAVTNAKRLLAMLWDLEWHTSGECVRVAGHRFGSSLHVLRDSGWEIETYRVEDRDRMGTYLYRLVSQEQGRARCSKVRLYVPANAVEALLRGEVTDEMKRIAEEALGIRAH